MQKNVVVRLETPAIAPDAAQLRSIEGVEEFNQLFEFRVGLVTKDTLGLDEQGILKEPASLVFSRDDVEICRIFGIVAEVHESLHSEGWSLEYRLKFVPRVWKASLTKKSQVYVDQSVPDIIKTKLEAAGLKSGDDFQLRLHKTYAPRELVIQYEETDLLFVSRLAEHLGIAYFFEHDSGKDVMVWSDDNSAFRAVTSTSTISFEKRGERHGVFELRGTTRALPGQVVVKDYNYRTPTVSLVKSAPIQEGGSGEIVEYGAHFKTPDEAQDIATVRAEEAFATRRIFSGESDVPQLRVGGKFTLEGHPRAEPNLLVTRVNHSALQTTFNYHTDAREYVNSFDAIAQSATYRPPRRAPKPRVHGAITGIVEAESPGQYAELDDDGRYHVRFMLDQGDAPRGKASSLIRMAQPHAGPGYGFHFPLRDGVEVILTCIDGDPDRPIITGAVPNPTTPSTVGSKNGQRNVIKTGGGTEINLDDTEGSTRFKVTVPHGNTTFQLGAPNDPTAGAFIGTANDAKIHADNMISATAGVLFMVSTPESEMTGSTSWKAKGAAMKLGPTAELTEDAQSIVINASTSTTTTSPAINLKGTTEIHSETPTFRVDAGEVKAEGKTLVQIRGGAVVTVDAGGNITIHSDTVVEVRGPTVTIAGSTTANITGTGTVNISGGTINLNAS